VHAVIGTKTLDRTAAMLALVSDADDSEVQLLDADLLDVCAAR